MCTDQRRRLAEMTIEKTQTLAPGTELVGRYKRTQFTATVREDGIYVEPAPLTPATAAGARSLVQIKKRRKQDGCPDGEVAFFCSACMASFCLPKGETPEVCPQGHPREVADDLASPAGDREAAASD